MTNQDFKKPTFFWKIFLIGVVVMFIAGLMMGYRIWGKSEKKANIKQLMAEVTNYVDSLEKKNVRLENQIRGMRDAVEKGRKAVQSMGSMKSDVTKLQDENKKLIEKMRDYTQLQEKVEELEALKIENEKLRKDLWEKAGLAEQLKSVKKENEELRTTLQKVKEAVKKPRTPLDVDHPSS